MGMRGTRCSDIECHAPAFLHAPSGPLICAADTLLSGEERTQLNQLELIKWVLQRRVYSVFIGGALNIHLPLDYIV